MLDLLEHSSARAAVFMKPSLSAESAITSIRPACVQDIGYYMDSLFITRISWGVQRRIVAPVALKLLGLHKRQSAVNSRLAQHSSSMRSPTDEPRLMRAIGLNAPAMKRGYAIHSYCSAHTSGFGKTAPARTIMA